ncbi:MAG: hydroxysqualene dehydroxylase HpnE [Methylophilaceae bacterium]
MKEPNIAIIGGGCAGLSAAVTLIDQGHSVTLFEAALHLGGRARTVLVEHNQSKHVLDNGQHILLGAYQETLGLLHKMGIAENNAFLRLPLQIRMQSQHEKPAFLLKPAHQLPTPFNLLFGFFYCEGLNFSERLTVIKFVSQLKLSGYKITEDIVLEAFLKNNKQNTKLIEMLWEPLCLAALNTPITLASTQIFLNVLRDTFTGSKENSDFLLPIVDLSSILANPLARYFQSKGGQIHLNSQVRKLLVVGDGFNVVTKEKIEAFSHVIVATPASQINKLLNAIPPLQQTCQQLEAYSYQPIYTIYIQFPSDTQLPNVMTGLSKKISQWAFDKGQLCGQKGLIAVVISGSGMHQEMSQDELAEKIIHELQKTFPHLTKPLWHQVIAEKRATFSCTPNLARPANHTTQPNLFLAGDYTYADYPATIEGAIRSGIACANLVNMTS